MLLSKRRYQLKDKQTKACIIKINCSRQVACLGKAPPCYNVNESQWISRCMYYNVCVSVVSCSVVVEIKALETIPSGSCYLHTNNPFMGPLRILHIYGPKCAPNPQDTHFVTLHCLWLHRVTWLQNAFLIKWDD